MKQTTLQHYTLDQIASFYENVSNRIIGNSRRGMLNNTDFSIISNNCWGGHVYRRYNIPYLSPTVGLYFYAEEYITFLQNIDKYLGGVFDSLTIMIRNIETNWFENNKLISQLDY